MIPVFQLTQVRKSFPGVLALREVDLTLHAGTIHALVGENGAGKSTLIHLLGGVLQPDNGEILLEGKPVRFADSRSARRHGIVTVFQEGDLFPDLSVAENIALESEYPIRRFGGVSWKIQRQRTQAALQAVGETLSPLTLASHLSPAQRQLVEIAAAVSHAAKVLVLDEPTSSLSAAEVDILFAHLRRFRQRGTAILYVSHRLEEIFALADEVTVLRDGQRVFTGPLAQVSRAQLIRHMVGRTLETKHGRPACAPGSVRFQCHRLTAGDGSCAEISLEVRAGEILGLYGLIGAGRSEWAQAVFGLRSAAGAEIAVDGERVSRVGPAELVRRGLVYLPEDRLRQGLCRGLAVRANLMLAALRRLSRWGWLSQREEECRSRALVERLTIRLASLGQPVGTLSGGNQQKVVLGRWLACAPNIFLLDEPTRGVNVGAKAEIHTLIQRLANEGRAIVLISSDLPEVLAQSDRVVVFREGRLAASFDPVTASAEEVAAAALPIHPISASARRKPLDSARSRSKLGAGQFRELALFVILLSLAGFLEWKSGGFLRTGNLRNLATDAALLSFCAVGTTLVILGGGLDISLGALMALSAGVAGKLWEQGQAFPLVALAALAVGGLGGLCNAGVSILGRVHPIVVTLGTLTLYRGLALWWIQQDVQVPGSARNWLTADWRGIPFLVWLSLAMLGIVWWLLNYTVSGRKLVALGSNPGAARRVGIHQARVWLAAFTVQGMLVGLAGLLALARSGSVQATSFEDKTLEAIAAAVVGGVAITGGRGSVWGVAVGCLFLVTLAPACLFLQISTHWQRTLVGAVLVIAVSIDALWRRRTA